MTGAGKNTAATFFGFGYPHHGQHAGFAPLARELQDQCEVVSYPHAYWILRFTHRLGLQRRATQIAELWFQWQERRVRRFFRSSSRRLVHYFFPEDGLHHAPEWKGSHLLVATCHQPLGAMVELEQQNPQRRLLEKLATCDGLVLMSGIEREAYARRFPGAQVVVIPHGVDTKFFSPGAASAGDGTLRLLTVGNWLRDYATGCETFAKLVEGGSRVVWTVVANENMLEEIRQRLPQHSERLRLLSRLSDEELRQEYRAADILFLPLRDAWANNALLEAMACGVPIVVSDLPATREYLGGARAEFVAVGQAGPAVAAIQRLWQEPLAVRQVRGRELRAWACQQYDWKEIARRHAELYATMLAGKAGVSHG